MALSGLSAQCSLFGSRGSATAYREQEHAKTKSRPASWGFAAATEICFRWVLGGITDGVGSTSERGHRMSSGTQESSSSGVVEQAKSELGDAASAVQEKAGELREQGRSKLGETLDERTTQVGGQAREAALAIRETGSHLRTTGVSGDQPLAGVFEAAADRVEQLGGYLEHASGDRLLRDAEDFARRHPWAVAGMGLVAGLAASRFLKASSERRYSGYQGQSAHRGSGSAGARLAYQPPGNGGYPAGVS